jgi:hypothetical protein
MDTITITRCIAVTAVICYSLLTVAWRLIGDNFPVAFNHKKRFRETFPALMLTVSGVCYLIIVIEVIDHWRVWVP